MNYSIIYYKYYDPKFHGFEVSKFQRFQISKFQNFNISDSKITKILHMSKASQVLRLSDRQKYFS